MNINYKSINKRFYTEDKNKNRLNSYHSTEHGFNLDENKFKLNKDLKVYRLNAINNNLENNINHGKLTLCDLKTEDRKIFLKNIKKLDRNLTIANLDVIH